MKKYLLIAMMICLVSSLVFATGAAEQTSNAAEKGALIGTSGMTGSWYPVAAAVSNQIRKYSDYVLTVQASGGSGENIRLMKQREYQLGMINTVIIDDAYNGKGNFAKEGECHDPIRRYTKYLKSIEYKSRMIYLLYLITSIFFFSA